MSNKFFSKKDWLGLLGLWFILSFISLLPMLFSYSHIQSGEIISGIHSLAFGDINVYLSYLSQINDGNYLLNTLFTTEDSWPMFRPFWLLIGLFGKFFSLTPLVTFHIARILCTGILLVVIMYFLKYFFNNKKQVWTALLLLTTTTGVGIWLILSLSRLLPDYATTLFWPIDMWVPEAFIFLSILHSPHYLISWMLILVIYLLLLLVINKNMSRLKAYLYSVGVGLLGILLFIGHPFHILPVYFVVGIYWLVLLFVDKEKAQKSLIPLFVFGVISSVGVFYHIYYMAGDWLTVVKAAQNLTPTPHISMVIAGFSIILPLALWQIYKLIKNKKIKNPNNLFLIIWIIVQIILIYLPIPWQRRMLQGLQIPLMILFVGWLYNFFSSNIKIKKINKYIGVGLLILFFLIPSSIYNVARDAVYYVDGEEHFYYSADLYKGMIWLKNNTKQDARIFCGPKVGNYIPGVAGRRVYASHGVETAYYEAKTGLIWIFFVNNRQDEKKYFWLKNNGITHIFYSEQERSVGSYNPYNKDYLELVFQNEEVSIFKFVE